MIITKTRYHDLSEVLSHFNMPYAIVKGNVLSLLAYNSPIKRISGDIDILLNKDSRKEFVLALKKCGFISNAKNRESEVFMYAFSHQTPSFSKKHNAFSTDIDLNFDIFWGETNKEIDMLEFISDCIDLEILGYSIKSLTPIKALIQLILHHFKDMNSIFLLATRKSIKYNMFKDVYYLLKNNLDKISLDKLYGMSSKYKIISYVFYVLYYTGQIFDDEILKQYIEAFRTPEGESLLNCYGLCDKERKEWKYDFKTRLEAENLYDLIKDDLTEKDKEKIAINKRVFMGGTE